MTPSELETELAALRSELAAARGIAEAALRAATAARDALERLQADHTAAPADLSSEPAGPLVVDLSRLSLKTDPSSPFPQPRPDHGPRNTLAGLPPQPERAAPPSPEPTAPPPAERPHTPPRSTLAGLPPQPAAPRTTLAGLGPLADLVPDDLSPAPAAADLSPGPGPRIDLTGDQPPTTPIDLDRVDGVANDDEERRKARLAALEVRLQRGDDGRRRTRLLELAAKRSVPRPSRGAGGLILVAVLAGLCVALDVWPLAFAPPIALLCWHLWRREQNDRLARLARGFAVPLHGRVLRDWEEMLAWINAFWPAAVRPQDLWTSHRHVAVACAPDEFPVLLDVQLFRATMDNLEFGPRVDLYLATTWPARLPLLRPGSSEMSPAIAELYARLRRAGFTIRVESEAGLLLHGSESVVERVRADPAQLVTLHNVVRDAITLARQLGATPAPTTTPPAA